MADVSVLARFTSQARGIMFYNVPLPEISVGVHFSCELEPYNTQDPNSIVVRLSPTRMLGYLAREASTHLCPLLTAGFQASG
jgi:hypothetical protein